MGAKAELTWLDTMTHSAEVRTCDIQLNRYNILMARRHDMTLSS
jgi:hypothetical protein